MNVLTDLLTDDTLLSMKLASLATTHVYAWLWRAGIIVTHSDLMLDIEQSAG